MFLSADYPVIKKLTPSDILYKQLQDDISQFYQISAGNMAPTGEEAPYPAFNLFSFTTGREQSVFQLCAELNLPYESLVVINSLPASSPIPAGKEIIIPNMPGVFLPYEPRTDLEYILRASPRNLDHAVQTIIDFGGDKRSYLFLPGERFNKTEQAFYLRVLFRFPVDKGRISSMYGIRPSPITGEIHFHNGIDIAADMGAQVLASRGGTVTETGYSDILGNYILLSHDDGYQSLYGHLDKALVQLNQIVYSGMIIANVGNTGLSTGPHLHFEIRRKGEPQDPLNMFGSKR